MEEAVILYVEDDESLNFITTESLERLGYRVTSCKDGEEGLRAYHNVKPNVCILDVMLPKMDGFTLARKIRENDQETPILFVTAKSLKEDKIEGLLLGADDYLVKPFSMDELELKIRIFLRRSFINPGYTSSSVLKIGSFKLDPANLLLTSPEGENRLTFKEAELLQFFYRKKEQLISREQILEALWGGNDYFAGRSLDVFISRLRKYLKSDPRIKIENRHGVGFRLVVVEKTS